MTMSRMSRRAVFLLSGVLPGSAGTAFAQAVNEVQIAPPSVSMQAGSRTSVFATAYAANNNVVAVEKLAWTSSNPNVVRIEVDPSSPDVAVLVGVAAGSAIIEARVGPKRGVATVEVKGGPSITATQPNTPSVVSSGGGVAALLKVNPAAAFMLPAEAATLIPEFIRADGSSAPPMQVTWRSLLPTVASVDRDGQVVAISAGQGLIEVTAPGGLVARVPVQVSNAGIAIVRRSHAGMMSPGVADTMAIIVPDQQNRRIPPTAMQWRSTDDAVAHVTPFGVVTAVGGGKADIVVTGFLQEVRVPVTVHRSIEFLSLAPKSTDTVRISLGSSQRFIAQPQASDGSAVSEAQVQWTLLDTTVAGFDLSNATLTPKRLGSTRLRVSVPGTTGLDATWIISVVAGTIGLSAERVGLSPGERKRVTASFIDDAGRPFGAANGLRWTSSAPTVASVDNDGNISAVGLGQSVVVASTTWGKTDTVRVFVQNELLVVSTRGGSSDLYALNRNAPTNFSQLTTDPASDINASFSPDGSTIAFVSTRSGGSNQEIYLMDADGSNVRRLTNSPASEDTPRWTPDGQHIVYASNASIPPGKGGAYQVWAMNVDGSEAKRLTEGTAFNSQPSVSPDGKTIAFTSTRDGNYDIYLMDLSGANQRNLTKSPGLEQMPVWFPDGKLAYVVEQKMGTARNAPMGRIAVKIDPAVGGTPTPITPADISVSDFAISRDGELIAVISSGQARGGFFTSKLVLLSSTPGGPRTEVPTVAPQEQVFSPSFRR